ncbi:hypothetical protein CRENBAI_010993 [Crenichthys baileyi]|uniref:Uncharacterized protein n=1 Tax=Crenichthys baileyi TaxID=28760 RepID=A0AAV9QRW3_9TELE
MIQLGSGFEIKRGAPSFELLLLHIERSRLRCHSAITLFKGISLVSLVLCAPRCT